MLSGTTTWNSVVYSRNGSAANVSTVVNAGSPEPSDDWSRPGEPPSGVAAQYVPSGSASW